MPQNNPKEVDLKKHRISGCTESRSERNAAQITHHWSIWRPRQSISSMPPRRRGRLRDGTPWLRYGSNFRSSLWLWRHFAFAPGKSNRVSRGRTKPGGDCLPKVKRRWRQRRWVCGIIPEQGPTSTNYIGRPPFFHSGVHRYMHDVMPVPLASKSKGGLHGGVQRRISSSFANFQSPYMYR